MSSGNEGTWRARANAAIESGPLSHWRGYFTRRMRWMLIIVGSVLLLLFGWIVGVPYVYMNFFMPKGGFARAQTVSTVKAHKTLWQAQVTAVGTLHAVRGADLSSELAGIVASIHFKPDEDVAKGDLLIQLRDSTDRAQLAALQASAALARQTYQRDAALMKTNAISRQAYDTALRTMQSTRAQADAQAATVAKKAIRAPFAGRVGIRLVDIGQFVPAGQSVVTLQQLDPIYVDFYAPQQQLAELKPGARVTLTSDAAPGRTFTGHIVATDPKVDPTTRNARVRAEIGNPGKKLLPGMFGTVVAHIGAAKPYITLPETAITYNPYGDTVFVVTKKKDKDGTEKLVAEQRFVTLGETRGDQVAVLTGITSKDTVVSSGQLKLKNGTAVKVNNSVQLPNERHPKPVEE